MTSGRHRASPEPRPARRRAASLAITLAATTTSGLSLSEVAQAAPSVDWDRVAACESSGRWDLNIGKHDGGLQFLDSTWDAYGGERFAPSANLASRTQQIAIAENVLRGQGIGAWPVCGPKGLGGTTQNRGQVTPSSGNAARTTSQPTPTRALPAVPDQPRNVQEAIRASGPTNPACVSLKRRGIPVAQLDRLNRAHPELHLDGNRNGVPCDVTYPRASSSSTASSSSSNVSQGSSTARQPSTSNESTTQTASGSSIVAAAQTWIGTPYLYGGESRSGVDCSGLVQRVFRTDGVSLPRTARQQLAATQRITRAQARPGDLVGNPGGTHIGIYIGDGRMIDAPRPGKTVQVRKVYSDMTEYRRVS